MNKENQLTSSMFKDLISICVGGTQVRHNKGLEVGDEDLTLRTRSQDPTNRSETNITPNLVCKFLASKLETTPKPIIYKVRKQNMLHSDSGLLLGNKNQWNTNDRVWMLSVSKGSCVEDLVSPTQPSSEVGLYDWIVMVLTSWLTYPMHEFKTWWAIER